MRNAILQQLLQHQAGLCVDALLARLQQPPEARQQYLKALRKLEAAGQVVITVPSAIRPHRRDVAGALVRLQAQGAQA